LIVEFLPVLQSTAALQEYACQILLQAFNYHIANISSTSPDASLTLEHIVTLTDMLLAAEDLEEGLSVVKRGQRWVQGRGAEKMWDDFEDDREFDPPGYIRSDEEFAPHPLEIDLRHRLAIIRLRLGNDDEAIVRIALILLIIDSSGRDSQP
jgi:general transcription factor 3C polypeptide 3 (transcription factor C subunit 4)